MKLKTVSYTSIRRLDQMHGSGCAKLSNYDLFESFKSRDKSFQYWDYSKQMAFFREKRLDKLIIRDLS